MPTVGTVVHDPDSSESELPYLNKDEAADFKPASPPALGVDHPPVVQSRPESPPSAASDVGKFMLEGFERKPISRESTPPEGLPYDVTPTPRPAPAHGAHDDTR